MMEYYYHAGAFVLGVVAMFLLTRLRIRLLLKDELRSYRKKLRKKRKWWPPELYPMLPLLKLHKDHYKKETAHHERELEDFSWRLEQQVQKCGEFSERVAELTRENQELKAIIEGPVSSESGKGKFSGTPETVIRGKMPFTPANAGKLNEPVILYFGIPDSQGNFPADRAEERYDNRKLFRIVHSAGSDRGELHYLSGELDMKAINNIDYYLLPVCDILNMGGRNSATRVLQEQKGEVLLASGKWSVTTRVKIKLL